MRRWSWMVMSCVAWTIGASAVARAGECVVNGTPLTPAELANALEFESSLPGQLAGVPFNVMSLQQLSLQWQGCGQDCVNRQLEGESQCGDLVTTPLQSAFLELYPAGGTEDASLINNVAASQSATGRWRILAQGWVFPDTAPQDSGAAYSFRLGTREVFDVTSNGGGTGPLPLDIGIRAGTWVTVSLCGDDGFFRWNPSRDLRFRVSSRLPPAGSVTLVDTVFYDSFVRVDDVYSVQVAPGSTVTVDVYLAVSANATGAQDMFGNQCQGASAVLDMEPALGFFGLGGGSGAYDGIQVLVSPDPGLTLTARSGMEYPAVPEPGAFASAVVALGALVLTRKRD